MPRSKPRACPVDIEPADGKLAIVWWSDKIYNALVAGRKLAIPDTDAARWGRFAAQDRYNQLKRDGKLPKRGTKR